MTSEQAPALPCNACNTYTPEHMLARVVANESARCCKCLLSDAYSGEMPDWAALEMSGALVKALVTAAAPEQRQMTTDGAGAKICKVFNCGAVIEQRFALCRDHQQQAPICQCGARKVGYNARARGWFSLCFECNQAIG